MTDHTLAHYGIKGMKWGRSSKSGSGSSSKSQDDSSSDHSAVKELRKKKPSQMSNDEIRKLNDRMNLEKNYKQLNPNAFVKGRNMVAGTIATVGMGVTIYNMVNSPAGKAAINKGKQAVNK